MSIFSIGDKTPKISPSAYCAPNCFISADVTISENVSVWPGASLRGDEGSIIIGENSNVQDNATLHTDPDLELLIGKNVTVGHNAILHSCTIGDNCLIGMGSIVLNRAKIAPYTLVGAGSLVAENKEFPEGVLLLGTPARVIRRLTDEEKQLIEQNALHYVQRAHDYRLNAKELQR